MVRKKLPREFSKNDLTKFIIKLFADIMNINLHKIQVKSIFAILKHDIIPIKNIMQPY